MRGKLSSSCCSCRHEKNATLLDIINTDILTKQQQQQQQQQQRNKKHKMKMVLIGSKAQHEKKKVLPKKCSPGAGLVNNSIASVTKLPIIPEEANEDRVKKVRVKMRVCRIVKGTGSRSSRCTFSTVTYLVPVTEIKRHKELLKSLQERSRMNRSKIETEAMMQSMHRLRLL